MCHCKIISTFFIAIVCCGVSTVKTADLHILDHDVSILVNETQNVELVLEGKLQKPVEVKLETQHKDVVRANPSIIGLNPPGPWLFEVTGLKPGLSLVYINSNSTPSSELNTIQAFVRVTVQHSYVLEYISLTVGWIYFAAWSVSFYPQIYHNWERKSVVGLNFDFMALNLLGFTLYAVFNFGLYFVPEIEKEYFERHPTGTNPVQMNDIVFAVHATFATLFTIIQCFCYESGAQRVSTTARSILFLFFLIITTTLGLTLFEKLAWLDFIYYCSYIKLTITLIKYIPQAYMNYQRKSTVGWSIGNVILDFTGGILSMAQMLVNAFNYDDLQSIIGDPVKFGLGLFSVVFDVFFIVQHYCLYRDISYELLPGDSTEAITQPSSTAESE
ncbi:cystinosin homolog isoform X2 [Nilaparvata lugens]|uniref:cystinosin homolog isoform X2 n=1 Tax=Nilaparvata lugens TaxID=108931 RepID=UPI00193DEB6A|nr:cystinosin homolog isoform X2 [Nilaparvata lugens]